MTIRIDVEKEMTACLRSVGAIVSDDLKGPAKNSNSDYWFPSEKVAVELKVMTKDYFSDLSYREWLNRAYHAWVARGLAPRIYKDNTLVNLADLNPQCYKEVENFVKSKLERSYKTASKQIQATKSTYDSKDATGLLLLANDGNYGVVPTMLQNITTRCLPKYTGINTVICFSVNMPMSSTETDMDVLPWCTWSRSSTRVPVAREFLEHIRDAWHKHVESLVGEKIHVIPGGKDSLANMQYINR